jgi:hypothetical protein
MSLSEKIDLKGLFGKCFICLSPPPITTPYSPLTHCIVYKYTYSHREGGGGVELTRENVRGAIVHKAGQKYQHDWLYLQSVTTLLNTSDI